MGWRESYVTLLELFPQVDARLIKGAVLEHGNDVAAAAEFILNEVVETDEGSSSSEQAPESLHLVTNNIQEPFQDPEQISALAGEEHAVTATDCGMSLGDLKQDKLADLGSFNPQSISAIIRLMEEQEAENGTSVDAENETSVDEEFRELMVYQDFLTKRLEMATKQTEMDEGVESDVRNAATSGSTGMLPEPFEEDISWFTNFVSQFSLAEVPNLSSKDVLVRPTEYPELAGGKAVQEYKTLPEYIVAPGDPSTSSGGLNQEEHPAQFKDNELASAINQVQSLSDGRRGCRPDVPRGVIRWESSEPDNWKTLLAGTSGPPSGTSELQGGQGSESGVDQSTSQVQEEQILDTEEAEELALAFAGYHEGYNEEISMGEEVAVHDDSISVLISAFDEDDGVDSMLSIQKSAISEEMDRADWENVNNNASDIQLNEMEPLGNLVDEAKAEKEALITSIEEIRVLRLMTDQAEFAARQSREEAALGGADVMAKVEEMRKMLSRARETNAVHAGEVFGEKAVLATEARELQQRLGQVKSEKATAVAALNEIKASLQARIESAIREREAAEQEKVTKEFLAKEALAKEEALVAKVAQESRELEVEAEACSKIREFLIEHGSIVDALQGEVAVLREDAEALKKDLESMSLSYSGSAFPTHILSQPGSQMYSSIVSQAGKLSELYAPSSDNLGQAEEGAASVVSNPGSPSLRSVFGVQKVSGDRKSWSSLPSLLRGLSGSQDLSGSAHSAYSSSASNLSSSKDALLVNQGEKSQVLGSDNLIMDTKYPSSPHSPASPAGAQEERELLKAKMAMFPGEELDMEFSGIHNLDVFRTVKPSESDEDDWQLLEKASSRSSSRSSVGK